MASLYLSVAEHPTLAWSSITLCLDLVIMNCLFLPPGDLAFVTLPIVSYQHSIPDPLLYLNAFIQEQSQL